MHTNPVRLISFHPERVLFPPGGDGLLGSKLGERRVPGIGVRFLQADERLEQALYNLLKNDKNADRDMLRGN
jgi:hypothetical protein